MPQLNDIIRKRNGGKFTKKPYRAWDISGTGEELEQTHEDAKIKNNPSQKVSASVDRNNQATKSNSNKANTKPTIGKQLGNNKETLREQSGYSLDNNSLTIEKQTDNQSGNNSLTIGEQLGNDYDSECLQLRLSKLSGIQKNIMDFLYDLCLKKNQKMTGPVETRAIAQAVSTTYSSTKTSINRLINKGFLIRLKGRSAVGGFINLRIPEEVMSFFHRVREEIDYVSNHLNIPVSIIREQIDNNFLYNSSSNINTITNNKNALPNQWDTINTEPLSDIGFTKAQLKQLYRLEITEPEVIQESINHFAYGLKYKSEKYGKYDEPLNVLMGVLRKGNVWNEPDYESPQNIALKQLLECREKQQRKRAEMLRKLSDVEFSNWESELTNDELQSIIPKGDISFKSPQLRAASLRNYFNENIWPKLKPNDV